MGQHKRNLTAIAAQKGELKPKERKFTKRQAKRVMSGVASNYVKAFSPLNYLTIEYIEGGTK